MRVQGFYLRKVIIFCVSFKKPVNITGLAWWVMTRRLKSVTFCNITKRIPFSNALTVSILLNIKLYHTIFILRIAVVVFVVFGFHV
jgi:hypothetical protein